MSPSTNVESNGSDKPTKTDVSLITHLEAVPVTAERQPFVPGTHESLSNFGTARANVAPSRECPFGSKRWAQDHQHQTVLQQHCLYFNPRGDGIIWPQDTFIAVRKWGWNILLSLLTVAIIHGGLSYPTSSSLIPDPFFRLYITRMHKSKHGSDSGTYDNEGRFRAQQFEDIFAKYDRDGKGGLTLTDAWNMCKGQRVIFDPFGWSAMMFEWLATYLLLWPDDGVMKKEDIRALYDGTIFYQKAEEWEYKQEMKRRHLTPKKSS